MVDEATEVITDEEITEDVIEDNSQSVEETEENEVSDADLDHIADVAINLLQDILSHFDVGEITIDEYEGDEGELILDITGDDLAVLSNVW